MARFLLYLVSSDGLVRFLSFANAHPPTKFLLVKQKDSCGNLICFLCLVARFLLYLVSSGDLARFVFFNQDQPLNKIFLWSGRMIFVVFLSILVVWYPYSCCFLSVLVVFWKLYGLLSRSCKNFVYSSVLLARFLLYLVSSGGLLGGSPIFYWYLPLYKKLNKTCRKILW